MRCARHPLSPATAALALALLAVGCGSSEEQSRTTEPAGEDAPVGAAAKSCADANAGIESLRVTGDDCAAGRDIAAAWANGGACVKGGGASRTACSVGEYRCLGVSGGRGVAVSCARPGRSIAFVVPR
jgi:hypothetical protein